LRPRPPGSSRCHSGPKISPPTWASPAATYVGISDVEGLREEIRREARLGYKGKFAIHPNQIETIESAFSPTEEEIDKALERADAEGTSSLDGKMTDTSIALRAQKLLRTADAVARSRK
jgi:citrate lyase subunit beta/citryl-CoA lyase